MGSCPASGDAGRITETPTTFGYSERGRTTTRPYQRFRVIHPRDAVWDELVALFPTTPGARQILDVGVDLVQSSCGMGVPYFGFRGERDDLKEWAARKGDQGIQDFGEGRNQVSIDGKPTGISATSIADGPPMVPTSMSLGGLLRNKRWPLGSSLA